MALSQGAASAAPNSSPLACIAKVYLSVEVMSSQLAVQVHLGEIRLHHWIESQAPLREQVTFIQHNLQLPSTSRQAMIWQAKCKLLAHVVRVGGSSRSMQSIKRRLQSGKRWMALPDARVRAAGAFPVSASALFLERASSPAHQSPALSKLLLLTAQQPGQSQ